MLSACVSSLAGDGASATVDADGRSVGYQPHVTFQQMQGQRRFERDRVQALVACGVVDGSQYVRPDDDAAVQLTESSNVLAPIVGLRQQRHNAAVRPSAPEVANAQCTV